MGLWASWLAWCTPERRGGPPMGADKAGSALSEEGERDPAVEGPPCSLLNALMATPMALVSTGHGPGGAAVHPVVHCTACRGCLAGTPRTPAEGSKPHAGAWLQVRPRYTAARLLPEAPARSSKAAARPRAGGPRGELGNKQGEEGEGAAFVHRRNSLEEGPSRAQRPTPAAHLPRGVLSTGLQLAHQGGSTPVWVARGQGQGLWPSHALLPAPAWQCLGWAFFGSTCSQGISPGTPQAGGQLAEIGGYS